MTPMLRLPTFAALLMAATCAMPALAQDAGTDDAAEATEETGTENEDLGLEMGTPIDGAEEDAGPGLGETYVLEVSGDWQVRCIRTSLEHDPCALYQLLADEEGNSVATIELVNLPEGQEAAAGATIVTPLETLLTDQITLSVDGGQGRRYPFSFCTQVGCVARVGFTDGEVTAFRRGARANLIITPATAPDQRAQLGLSLIGISAGLDRIIELNGLNAQAIEAARAAEPQQ